MSQRRYPPWHYPRDRMPHRHTLKLWRQRAAKMARAAGAPKACGICKRPMRQWGQLKLRHPRSYGKSRLRHLCISCANLVIHMLDVLEWHGAQDHLPPEAWEDHPMPEDSHKDMPLPPDLRPEGDILDDPDYAPPRDK